MQAVKSYTLQILRVWVWYSWLEKNVAELCAICFQNEKEPLKKSAVFPLSKRSTSFREAIVLSETLIKKKTRVKSACQLSKDTATGAMKRSRP